MNPMNVAEERVLNTLHPPGKMVQLGNKKNIKPGPTYEESLTKEGWEVTSIDLNGEDGALAYDLAYPIRDLWGQFDVLTNFGTSEHVFDQVNVWKNIHNLVKPGGRFVHTLAKVATRDGHCDWFISPRFYQWLAENNGYSIETSFDAFLKSGDDRYAGTLCCCRMRKGEDVVPFKWPFPAEGLWWGSTPRSIMKRHHYGIADECLNAAEEW